MITKKIVSDVTTKTDPSAVRVHQVSSATRSNPVVNKPANVSTIWTVQKVQPAWITDAATPARTQEYVERTPSVLYETISHTADVPITQLAIPTLSAHLSNATTTATAITYEPVSITNVSTHVWYRMSADRELTV